MIGQVTWQRLVGSALVALALLLLPGMVVAQEAVTVQLDPVGESGVSGTATLTAAGEGTDVMLDVEGLASGAEARATMHAGTCAMPSASFATLPDLTADETGAATATGSVLFREMEHVALTTMADGEHIIAIQAGGEIVACGVIPELTAESTIPALPTTGEAAFPLATGVAGVLGSCALSARLFLRHRSRSRAHSIAKDRGHCGTTE
jgi:hypothetical protein